MKHTEIRRSVIYVVGRIINDVHFRNVTFKSATFEFAPKTKHSPFPVVDLAANSDVTVAREGDAYTVTHAASGTSAEVQIDAVNHMFDGRYGGPTGPQFTGNVEGLKVTLSDDEFVETIEAVLGGD